MKGDLAITTLSLSNKKTTWLFTSTVLVPTPEPINRIENNVSTTRMATSIFAVEEDFTFTGKVSIFHCLVVLSYSLTLNFCAVKPKGNNSINTITIFTRKGTIFFLLNTMEQAFSTPGYR